MISLCQLSTFLAFILPIFGSSYDLDSLSDSLLHEIISRMGPEDYGLPPTHDEPLPLKSGFPKGFEAHRDPSIKNRDEEYLEHSSLFGHQYVTGGAGEGFQRLKPDGSIENMQLVKTDRDLLAFCNPPNPCPSGYTANDDCLENFENTAAFSREYQAAQDCMCDSEHVFDCSGSTQENEMDALERTFENEGLAEVALDRLIKTMKPLNPFLDGEKLPVVAKKSPKSSIK